MYLLMWVSIAAAVLGFLTILFLRALFLRMEVVDVNKRSVFITGCDSGFGHLLAKTLDSRGVKVFAGCLTPEGAKGLKATTSDRLQPVVVDITNKESVKKCFEFVRDSLKGEGLWALVNNAGVMPCYALSEWLTVDDFESCCKVNLFGTISVTLAFMPLLRKSRGRLVTVCSVTSDVGIPSLANYCVSKAGAKMFTICLRRELFHAGVTAHTIEPGGFKTNITNKYRLIDSFVSAYHKAAPEAQEFYGGNISTHIYNGIMGSDQYINSKPQMVVDAMTHALLSKFPKDQYLVGFDANFFFRLCRYLPTWVVDYFFGYPVPYGPKCKGFKSD